MNKERGAVIIGVGNLGRALAKNFQFELYGMRIEAVFDLKSVVADWKYSHIPIYEIEEIDNYIKSNKTEIAVLTVPGIEAKKLAGILVRAGIKAIWNFTEVELRNIPENIIVENVHFSDSLLYLNYHLNMNDNELLKVL